jgi:hypothetical protein
MRPANLARSCLLLILACSAPAAAETLTPSQSTAPVAAPTMLSLPEMFIAAKKAETQKAIAQMHARLAEMVPANPQNDAISRAAAGYTAHWNAVIENFTNMQMNSVVAVITEVNEHHQQQIEDHQNAPIMVQPVSLFEDPDFLKMIRMPINLSLPLPAAVGFFGS